MKIYGTDLQPTMYIKQEIKGYKQELKRKKPLRLL